MITDLISILNILHQKDIHFRLENDEEGFYLSIIDREIYPRIWADNYHDNRNKIFAETTENLLNRTVLAGKDWSVRFYGDSVDKVFFKCYEFLKENKY